jgi:hypothetical protein
VGAHPALNEKDLKAEAKALNENKINDHDDPVDTGTE